MIKTDSVYIKDLQEIYNLFETGVEVTHAFSVCGKTCTNKYTVGIAEYNYQEPAADGKQIKRFVKSSFYDAMSKYLNQKSAWGAFTGIRPVKYWRELAARGENPREVFLNEFFVSPRKVDLTEEIIKNQILDKDGKDLYVGIPFCPSRCHYCSFISAEIGKSNLAGDYVKTLAAEIKTVKKAHNDFKTVYIGGGTPVCLDIRDLETILKTVGKGNGKEYTVEAGRCDELTREKTELLKNSFFSYKIRLLKSNGFTLT